MISYEDARDLKRELEPEYEARHADLRKLREFWDGSGWWKYDASGGRSLASLFRDSTRGQATPDIKLIHNVTQEVCVKYQSFLSPLPMIHVYPDPPVSARSRAQASLKERALYGAWANGRMSLVFNEVGWYLPLMGDSFLGVWPDFERKLPVPLLRSPEYAFPVPGYDGRSLDALIFCWKVSETTAKRNFPNWTPKKKPKFRMRGRDADPSVEVLEYSDDNEFARFIDGERVNGVEHKLGFNLFEQLAFIHVPGKPFNHGAVEQIIGLNESHNFLYSLVMQKALNDVFPPLVLENPYRFNEEIDTGSGSVLAVNEGGRAYYLQSPNQSILASGGILTENERMMKQGASVPGVSFGDPRGLGSIVTGKAINELQGAGTGSTVEMVQGVGIGLGITAWNEKALCIMRRMFAEDTIELSGTMPKSYLDVIGKKFTEKIKGKQIVGGYRNEVVFSPHIDAHEKVVMGLQLQGGGLVSREWNRNQIGIPDTIAMDEEIMEERVQDLVFQAIEAQVAQGMEPTEAEDQAFAYLQGETNPATNPAATPAGAPPSLPPPPGAPPGSGGPPIGTMAGGGQQISMALQQPPGSPPPVSAPTGEGPPQPGAPMPGGEEAITLEQAVKDFGQVEVKGKVFLVGEIVEGQTDDDIEVALTDSSDRQPLSDGLPQYAGRLTFHTVSAEPTEPHVPVGPGAVPEAQGEEPDLAALLAG